MIRINDTWAIDSDGSCYTVGKIVVRNQKQRDGSVVPVEGLTDVRYYGNLQRAIEGFCRCFLAQRVKDTEGDIKALYETVQACTKELKSLIETHFPAIEFAC